MFSLSIASVTTRIRGCKWVNCTRTTKLSANNGRIGRSGYARRSDNAGGIRRAGFNILRTVRHMQEDTRSRSTVAEESPSDTPRAHRAIHRDGITSCQSRDARIRSGRAILRAGTAERAAVLWCPNTAYRSAGPSRATCPPLSKSRSNEIIRTSHVISPPPLPSVRAIKWQFRYPQFCAFEYNIIDRRRNNCEPRAAHKRRFVSVLVHA